MMVCPKYNTFGLQLRWVQSLITSKQLFKLPPPQKKKRKKENNAFCKFRFCETAEVS